MHLCIQDVTFICRSKGSHSFPCTSAVLHLLSSALQYMEHNDLFSSKGSSGTGLGHSCRHPRCPMALAGDGSPRQRRMRAPRVCPGAGGTGTVGKLTRRDWLLTGSASGHSLRSKLPPHVFLARTRSCHLCLGRREKDREAMEPRRLLPGDSASPRLPLHASDVMDGGVGAWRPDESYFPCSAVISVISLSHGKMD